MFQYNPIYQFVIFIIFLTEQKLSLRSSINPEECGRRISEIKSQNRIVGGQQADSEDWGWQVLVQHRNIFRCGASLINTEWVITAAHCINKNEIKSDFSLRLGLHNRVIPEDRSILKNVSQIILHQQYNEFNFHNDVALMKLSSPITYSDYILPVCLPSQGYDFSNKKSWATGWGRTSTNLFFDSTSVVLREMETQIFDANTCQDRYKILNPPIFNSLFNICAGGNGKSICLGDSGGPIVVKVDEKWVLAGISSWVLSNNQNELSCFDGGVFAKASSYINWIKQNIESESTSTKLSNLANSISSLKLSVLIQIILIKIILALIF